MTIQVFAQVVVFFKSPADDCNVGRCLRATETSPSSTNTNPHGSFLRPLLAMGGSTLPYPGSRRGWILPEPRAPFWSQPEHKSFRGCRSGEGWPSPLFLTHAPIGFLLPGSQWRFWSSPRWCHQDSFRQLMGEDTNSTTPFPEMGAWRVCPGATSGLEFTTTCGPATGVGTGCSEYPGAGPVGGREEGLRGQPPVPAPPEARTRACS